MEGRKKVLLSVVILLVLVAGFYLTSRAITRYTGFTITGNIISESNIESFAKCLSENNVELYVMAGCSHCAEQEALFGKYLKYLDLTDCATNLEICLNKQIGIFPTWIINGKLIYGFRSLEDLNELSGCKLR